MTDPAGYGQRTTPYFYTPAPAPPPPSFSTTTRLLCSAAYLDHGFARTVIDEVVENEQRAVAPSADFDLEPVVRHSYRARKMLFVRDLVLTGLLLAGLILVPFVTLAWILTAAGILAMRRNATLGSGAAAGLRSTALFVTALIVLCCLGAFTPLLLLPGGSDTSSASDPFGGPYGGDTGGLGSSLEEAALQTAFSATALVFLLVMLPVALAAGTLVTSAVHRISAFRAMLSSFGAAVPGTAPPLPNDRIARRMAWVRAAQYGNVTVHARNPLLGAGNPVSGASWTMALTLRPDPNATHGGSRPPTDVHTLVDPQEIHLRLRERVLALADPALPEHQRVPGVRIADHVVADGERRDGDPLLDREHRPHAVAAPEAITAIIRHPQGGLRYYQRFVVGVDGKQVMADDGSLVLPAQSQEIAISAFVHVAVEGGRLYAEFIGMLLPPVREEFHVADRLRPTAAPGFGAALLTAVKSWPDTVKAPLRVARSLWQMATLQSRMNRARTDSRENLINDYGARISVRELASEELPRKFLQALDAEKYLQLVEKAVSEALLDYLDERQIDTSEYRRRMAFIQNNNTTISDSTFVNSAVAVGANASASK
ncbi:hypothetical protein O7627_30470 [Solwaraspora sp. WMMD1047]|uniref:hypothetical protein n=1 Tax=Solwaraspora sp. WMMD1047 TaxID=3016102 RepID=UPI002417E359|nr:hypothetical protein [Solwaraspora sp. WMMD1047]MDG4833601.1 hypothetical protein [Solwaraspora sp. WMMD1047]